MNIEHHLYVTKKELCIKLGLHNESVTRFYYQKLRKLYFTDTVLQKMGLDDGHYKSIRRFNKKHTAFIFQNFKEDL